MAITAVRGVDIWVSDLSRAVDFYRTLVGFCFQWATATEALMRVGGAEVRLRAGAKPCHKPGPWGIAPMFAVVDIEAAHNVLTAADVPVVFRETVPGANFLTFLDLDGNAVQLVQYTDPRVWRRAGP